MGSDESGRKRSIETTLRNIEEQQKVRKGVRPSLTIRMRQAGLNWSKKTYFVACLAAAGFFASSSPLAVFGVGAYPRRWGLAAAGGLLLPHLYVSRRSALVVFRAFHDRISECSGRDRARCESRICPSSIASGSSPAEAKEPVRSEFKGILDDQTLGVPMDQAVQRLPERIPVAEANFFAIVISLQSRSGGSLSEALGNLSRVLRERRKMAGKIKAMSSEAKASAGIIGSLPVIVTCLLYLSAPEYISLLFTTLLGKIVLVGAAYLDGNGGPHDAKND